MLQSSYNQFGSLDAKEAAQKQQHRSKVTIKDLLTLLIGTAIPVAIGIYTAIMNQQAQKSARQQREFEIQQVKELYQQQLYKNFIDDMYVLHKDGEFNESADPWVFANARYRAAHREFDNVRKVQALRFLKERELIGRQRCTNTCVRENISDIVRLDGLVFDHLNISSDTGIFTRLNLTCIQFNHVSILDSLFLYVDLNGVVFNNSRLNGTIFHGSSLNCVVIQNTSLDRTNASDSTMNGIQLIDSDSLTAILSDIQKEQANLNKLTAMPITSRVTVTTKTSTTATTTTSTSSTTTTSTATTSTSSTTTTSTATTSTSSTTTTSTSTATTSATTITTATTSTTTTATTTSTTAAPVINALWPFDKNALELYNSFDGTAVGSPSYTTSFLGYGAAINIIRKRSQYVFTRVVVPLNLFSFTVEAWIYPIALTSIDYGIFGQCQLQSLNLCFYFMVRNVKLYCGFYGNNVAGSTTLTMSVWTHVACVYDANTQTQTVWLNGILDGSNSSSTPYQGQWGVTTIGAENSTGVITSFNGYLDQVRFESRAKISTEIWNDASLYVYYSFDGGSLLDNGPNHINGTSMGTITSVTGRVNGAIQFSSGSYVYYTYPPFYFLGINNHAFSISVWAQPTGSYATSTLVFVEHPSGWCVHFLGMTATGHITAHTWNGVAVTTSGPILPLNTWTHIGFTYSLTNGIQLYINGSFHSTSGSTLFVASSVPMYMVLGTNHGRTSCSPYYGGQFIGALDEFYVHNRELTASQVYALAHP